MWYKQNKMTDGYEKDARSDDGLFEPEVVELPIDGVLDLHTFHPRDVKELVPDYLDECQRRGIYEVRIIHGKGTGTLRKIVHSVLKKHPAVKDFHSGGHGSGSWGATLVDLISL